MFKIDVGGIAPQDVEQYMQKVMTQMKRHQVVDASTGRVDLRYNPLSIEEDYFIPHQRWTVLYGHPEPSWRAIHSTDRRCKISAR